MKYLLMVVLIKLLKISFKLLFVIIKIINFLLGQCMKHMQKLDIDIKNNAK